jgi:Tfp pilus assembly protein PilZ
MGLVTSQQITKFYDAYKNIDVTFTKQVIEAVGLQAKQVFLKCINHQWPCIIYSTSLTGAKVIANLSEKYFELLRKSNNLASLRFCFKYADKSDPIAFFVPAKVTGYNPYSKENPNLHFINLTYTQRPADDLIEVVGSLLEANVNSKKRSEERILITTESLRKLGFASKDIRLTIQNVPRKGILRDLSFSGAKLLISGIAKYLVEKEVEFKLELEDQKKILILKGKVLRVEEVEGRKDIAAIGILYDENTVPIEYKMVVNDYLTRLRKTTESS